MSDVLPLLAALVGLATAAISAVVAMQQRKKPEAHWTSAAQPVHNPNAYYQPPGASTGGAPSRADPRRGRGPANPRRPRAGG